MYIIYCSIPIPIIFNINRIIAVWILKYLSPLGEFFGKATRVIYNIITKKI